MRLECGWRRGFRSKGPGNMKRACAESGCGTEGLPDVPHVVKASACIAL